MARRGATTKMRFFGELSWRLHFMAVATTRLYLASAIFLIGAPAVASPVMLSCTASNTGSLKLTTTFRLDTERGVAIEGFVGNDPRPLHLRNAPLISTDRSLAWQWQEDKNAAVVHFVIDRITLAAHSWSNQGMSFYYSCVLIPQRL